MSRFIPIISVILLIVLLVGGYFFWWPKYQEFKEQGRILEQKARFLEQKNSYYSNLGTLYNKLDTYKENFDKIDSALPVEVSLPVLFDLIQNITSENGLVLNDISSSVEDTGSSPTEISEKSAVGEEIKPDENSEIKKISLSLSLSSSYSSFKNLLSAIYKSARLFEVNSISFSSPEEKELKEGPEVKALFDFNLSLETYFLQKSEIQQNTTVAAPTETTP